MENANKTIIMDLNAPENEELKEFIALKNKSEEVKKKIGKIDEFLGGRQRVIGTGESIKEMYIQKQKEKENLEKSLSDIESQMKNKIK